MPGSAASVATLYTARKGRVDVVDVPEFTLVAVVGSGDPNGPDFAAATRALFAVSYGAHFLIRKRLGDAPRVLPLEALWWVADAAAQDTFVAVAAGTADIPATDRDAWGWQAFIVQPDPVDEATLDEAMQRAAAKQLPALGRVRVQRWCEGRSAQTLHVGPYATEAASVALLHRGIAAAGYRPHGRHHEIYLGDPRRSAPERLRTILRHPVERA